MKSPSLVPSITTGHHFKPLSLSLLYEFSLVIGEFLTRTWCPSMNPYTWLHMPLCTLLPLLEYPSWSSYLWKPYLPIRTKMQSNNSPWELNIYSVSTEYLFLPISIHWGFVHLIFFYLLIYSFNKYDPSLLKGLQCVGLEIESDPNRYDPGSNTERAINQITAQGGV